jgi:hypothetical protein
MATAMIPADLCKYAMHLSKRKKKAPVWMLGTLDAALMETVESLFLLLPSLVSVMPSATPMVTAATISLSQDALRKTCLYYTIKLSHGVQHRT